MAASVHRALSTRTGCLIQIKTNNYPEIILIHKYVFQYLQQFIMVNAIKSSVVINSTYVYIDTFIFRQRFISVRIEASVELFKIQ